MRVFPDLLRPLSAAASLEAGLDRTLRRIMRFTGARGGLILFRPPRRAPAVALATRGLPRPVRECLQAIAAGRAPRRAPARATGVLRIPLGAARRTVGELVLVAGTGRRRMHVRPDFARELGAALELVDESRRRADELSALYATSRLITARLDLASVLEAISRSVSALIGSTGCGIALLDADGSRLVQAAAHGLTSDEWSALELPMGQGIIGRCAATRQPILVDDVRRDPLSARREEVDVGAGIRSMLCVPMMRGDRLIGVIAAFSDRPAAFAAQHQRVLERFGEQAGIALHNAQLFEDSVRRGRETKALLGAGRAVSASLDVDQTIRVILEEARGVLGVASCGLLAVEPGTDEMRLLASLDLPTTFAPRVRVRVGEGIGGMAVAERRPMQSPDTWNDSRVRYPELQKASGLRSMLAVPMTVGDRAIGALYAFRRDVHTFSPAEEELFLALADQAAIALEHARLYEEMEARVQERTRQLDEEKRFVEVVLETLPLGVFVLDGALRVVRANPAGADVLGGGPPGRPFRSLFPDASGDIVERLVRGALGTDKVQILEHEMTMDAVPRVLRLTAAALPAPGEAPAHAVVLVEEVTRAKRLERQMLLAERLTTAGRLAAGVAHELNNPLATIAGCAESLLERTRGFTLDPGGDLGDLRAYLATIEEEAYRCKEITGTLLQFVRDPGSRREPTDLNALVARSVELLAHQSRFASSTITTELDAELPEVNVNEGQLRQVILGLAANGLEAMEGRGHLTIRTRLAGDEALIEFADEGPGIADEVLPRIFDPFFTTKPPGQGTGLGLAIAQGIVTDHAGRIEVASKPGEGALFRVVLPL